MKSSKWPAMLFSHYYPFLGSRTLFSEVSGYVKEPVSLKVGASLQTHVY